MENSPSYSIDKFKCPHCHVIAKQEWYNLEHYGNIVNNIYQHTFLEYRNSIQVYEQEAIRKFIQKAQNDFPKIFSSVFPDNLDISQCHSCNNSSLWIDKNIVFPKTIPIEIVNEDLNDDIKDLYREASKIFMDSPKGATAILRLALQKLLIQIGKDGKNINNDIKELVSEGLSPKIQKALDLLRVIGNNAVHPGQIDLDDNRDAALKLFKILNMIADDMITKPREMESLYDDIIPDDTKKYINQRDGRV
ncbi:DUF4145 domain-containing protein [Sulfurimonas sp. RIFOXYB12_FULL_35_9]|jgi:hypothetical protein|uniref:DUF4145 domain-containing protein n=1 Tax=Sulfurimonas sp. RIFOXYB12_FULL_35_9 TaxID=1802256 RepID=UPI0008C96931|nr:DUF4145 domain-containing protein [Sulfurimonas sp. RIFOXYB12_FULL_35_9]MBS4068685.1 DUF4145 domain-containing protein [Sulfurimonas sp.]OHE03684.1 MAG: hypothetical protein A2345_04870 [Sulfurimonas sp. RIFOXYB12_FULL_35_9]